MRGWRWFVLSLPLWAASCAIGCGGGGAETPTPVSRPDPHEGEGVFGKWVSSGGYQRTYELYVPEEHDGRTPLPLVILLHGASGKGASIRENLRMDAAARRHGYAAVYPDGLASWAVGFGTNADRAGIDDVLFIRSLIQQIAANLPVDRRRVSVLGFSDGASMAHRLGCQLTDELAAIATVSPGVHGLAQLYGRPTRPLPVFLLGGTADELFPVTIFSTAAAEWAWMDGCQSTRTDQLPELSAANPVTLVSYDGCSGDVSVRLYLVTGGRHTMAVSLRDTTLADFALDFLAGQVKPQ